jgi:hypothetical protein
MKSFSTIIKIAILAVIGTAILLLFWAYVIPGILLWWIFRGHYRDWIGGVVTLLIVVSLRHFAGHWPTSVGELGSQLWYVELASCLLSWAVGWIFVSAGYRIPQYFLEGLNSGGKSNVHRTS